MHFTASEAIIEGVQVLHPQMMLGAICVYQLSLLAVTLLPASFAFEEVVEH